MSPALKSRAQRSLSSAAAKSLSTAVSTADGSFQILTGASGRFFLVVSAKSFRQLQTPDFYAGQFDSIERNVVLEPEWARESIVVTATGTPIPQSQTSSATTVLGPLDLALRDDLASDLRLMPGATVVQSGQSGAATSLFVRGGDSDDNKMLLDGVDIGDLGNRFDFGTLSTTAIESAEVYRGPDASLYGAGADASVVSLTTPHGTTSFPSLLFHGDAGNFDTSREELEIAGAHQKLDYLGAFSWLQTANDLPRDEYHVATSAANLGWQPNGTTQIRGTLHYGVDGTGVPNAWDFYHVADDATQKDQDIFLSARSTTRPRQASITAFATASPASASRILRCGPAQGIFQAYGNYCFGPAYLGSIVNITGANGYSATGQAVLDYAQLSFRFSMSPIAIRPAIRATSPSLRTLPVSSASNMKTSAAPNPAARTIPRVAHQLRFISLAVHGDFKSRFFYTLGGSIEHYSLFGLQTSPRAGSQLLCASPAQRHLQRAHVFSSTSAKQCANPSSPIRMIPSTTSSRPTTRPPSLRSTSARLPRPPCALTRVASSSRSSAITFFSSASYFHNEFGKEIEYVGLDLVPALTPNLTPSEQATLESILQANFAYELTINSEAFRAQGIETSVESGIGSNLFLRGGYTYLDAVVQRSFTNDDAALLGPIPTWQNNPNGIPIGPYSPLEGARPFRRSPHTGYFAATYSNKRITGVFSAAFASRSDDSTYLEGEDASGGNSLLLPNRNLDYGYAKLDLGGSYQWFSWLDVYAQADNLLNSRNIAPIGYPSLPFTLRAGLRLRWGPGSGH